MKTNGAQAKLAADSERRSAHDQSWSCSPGPGLRHTWLRWKIWGGLAVLGSQIAVGHAQPTVQWATVAGSPQDDYPYGLALTPAGQLYVAGSFDPVLGANGYYQWPSKSLSKFDGNGVLLESQSSRGELLRGVAVDSQGTYYVTGLVWDSQRLGVGLTNDFYMAKYSSTGALMWERTGGLPTWSRMYLGNLGGSAIALDRSGNIYAVGGSTGPAIFGSVTLPNTTGGPLLCKYDPNGALLWIRRIEGTPGSVAGAVGSAGSIALDPQGNIVIAGYLNNGSTDFGGLVVPIAGPYSGYSFVAKYNSDGQVLWARQSHASKVAVDNHGSIYGTGSVISSDSTAATGFYCGKFDSAGNPVWERIVPGAYANDIALDGKGQPVIAGEFSGTVEFDGALVQSTGDSYADFLICKADAAGVFQWALSGGGAAYDTAIHVVCDRTGNSYLSGVIRKEPGVFGSFPLDPIAPGEGTTDVFLSQVTDPSAIAVELKIAKIPAGIILSWPAEAANYLLETCSLFPAASWDTVTNTPTVGATECTVELPIGGNAQFFRLRKP